MAEPSSNSFASFQVEAAADKSLQLPDRQVGAEDAGKAASAARQRSIAVRELKAELARLRAEPQLGDPSRVQQLCRQAGRIPASCRRDVWRLLLLGRADGHGGDGTTDGSSGQVLEEAILAIELDLDNQRVVRVDVERTRRDVPQFQSEAIRDLLSRVLTYHCKQAAVGYKQGMHEVLAPFVALSDPPMPVCDIYLCFEAFLERFLPYAFGKDDDFVSLQICFRLFRLLLLYHEPALCRFLDTWDMAPELFATGWFLTLFAVNVDLPTLFEIWDLYLAYGDGGNALHHFAVLAYVIDNADFIMQSDEASLPERMCNLPHGLESVEALHALMDKARLLMQSTPESFRKILWSALYSHLEKPQLDMVLRTLQMSSCIPVSAEEVAAHVLHRNPNAHQQRAGHAERRQHQWDQPAGETPADGGEIDADGSDGGETAGVGAIAAASDGEAEASECRTAAAAAAAAATSNGVDKRAPGSNGKGKGRANDSGGCSSSGSSSEDPSPPPLAPLRSAAFHLGASEDPSRHQQQAGHCGDENGYHIAGGIDQAQAQQQGRSHRQLVVLDCRPRAAFERCRLAPALHLDPAMLGRGAKEELALEAKLRELLPLRNVAHLCLVGLGASSGASSGAGLLNGARGRSKPTDAAAVAAAISSDPSGEAMGLRSKRSPTPADGREGGGGGGGTRIDAFALSEQPSAENGAAAGGANREKDGANGNGSKFELSSMLRSLMGQADALAADSAASLAGLGAGGGGGGGGGSSAAGSGSGSSEEDERVSRFAQLLLEAEFPFVSHVRGDMPACLQALLESEQAAARAHGTGSMDASTLLDGVLIGTEFHGNSADPGSKGTGKALQLSSFRWGRTESEDAATAAASANGGGGSGSSGVNGGRTWRTLGLGMAGANTAVAGTGAQNMSEEDIAAASATASSSGFNGDGGMMEGGSISCSGSNSGSQPLRSLMDLLPTFAAPRSRAATAAADGAEDLVVPRRLPQPPMPPLPRNPSFLDETSTAATRQAAAAAALGSPPAVLMPPDAAGRARSEPGSAVSGMSVSLSPPPFQAARNFLAKVRRRLNDEDDDGDDSDEGTQDGPSYLPEGEAAAVPGSRATGVRAAALPAAGPATKTNGAGAAAVPPLRLPLGAAGSGVKSGRSHPTRDHGRQSASQAKQEDRHRHSTNRSSNGSSAGDDGGISGSKKPSGRGSSASRNGTGTGNPSGRSAASVARHGSASSLSTEGAMEGGSPGWEWTGSQGQSGQAARRNGSDGGGGSGSGGGSASGSGKSSSASRAGSGSGPLAWAPAGMSKSSMSFSEAAVTPLQTEAVGFDEWLLAEQMATGSPARVFQARRVLGGSSMAPCRLVISDLHITQLVEVRGWPGEVMVEEKRAISSLVRVTSRRKVPDLVVFHFRQPPDPSAVVAAAAGGDRGPSEGEQQWPANGPAAAAAAAAAGVEEHEEVEEREPERLAFRMADHEGCLQAVKSNFRRVKATRPHYAEPR